MRNAYKAIFVIELSMERKIWKFCTATFEPLWTQCWRESLKTSIEKRSWSFWPEKKVALSIYSVFRSRRSNARRKQVSQTENGIIPRSPNNGMYELWQYGLWSCQTGGTKLERFLLKNQHKDLKEIIELINNLKIR